MLSEIPDKCEGQKTPFFAVAKVTTYTETGRPYCVTECKVGANTLEALKLRMDGFKTAIGNESRELGKKITVVFSGQFQLDQETGKYGLLQQVEEERELFAQLLSEMSSEE
jgi:hypothetical protein